MNFLGVTVEMVFKKRFQHVRLKSKLKRRIGCVLASPLLAMSAISNFYFFADTDIGNVFLKRFFEGKTMCNINKKIIYFACFAGGASNLLLLFFLYQCCQVSTELNKL